MSSRYGRDRTSNFATPSGGKGYADDTAGGGGVGSHSGLLFVD